MQKMIGFIGLLLISYYSQAQYGCTDPLATNYNPSATINDGSCVYPPTTANAQYITDLPTVSETSGLAWHQNQLWTHDDSGGPASIFLLDTATGKVLKTVVIDNYPNIDWEDITTDSNYLYLAETGNNNGTRTDLKILKIAFADIGNDSIVHVQAQAIHFNYADQTSFTPNTSTNFDAEAITSIGDSLYLFSKNWGDHHTKLYLLPKVPGNYTVSPHATYNVGCLITGACSAPNKKEITLIGYTNGLPPNSMLWVLNDFPADSVFNGNKRKISLPYSSVWQTEGITYTTASSYFISTERINQLSLPAKLFRLQQTWNQPSSTPLQTVSSIKIYPNPGTHSLTIFGSITGLQYAIIHASGAVLMHGKFISDYNEINIRSLAKGTYIIRIWDKEQVYLQEKIVKE